MLVSGTTNNLLEELGGAGNICGWKGIVDASGWKAASGLRVEKGDNCYREERVSGEMNQRGWRDDDTSIMYFKLKSFVANKIEEPCELLCCFLSVLQVIKHPWHLEHPQRSPVFRSKASWKRSPFLEGTYYQKVCLPRQPGLPFANNHLYHHNLFPEKKKQWHKILLHRIFTMNLRLWILFNVISNSSLVKLKLFVRKKWNNAMSNILFTIIEQNILDYGWCVSFVAGVQNSLDAE